MKRFINLLILQILTFVSFSQTRTTSGDAIRKEITPKYVNGVIKQLTIAQLKAQPISSGDSTTLYYVTDTGRKGYFELDKNDNSSVGNDSTIIVTNNGKRLKRTIEQYLSPSTTGKYYRGDKTWQDLSKSTIGLSNVDNTSDLNKPISTATQTALLGKLDKGYSISELRGLSNSVLAATQIFYCSEVGKEGFWKYDASDNSSTDNLGTILVTSGGKRLKRIFEKTLFSKWFDFQSATAQGKSDIITNMISIARQNACKLIIQKGAHQINSINTYKDLLIEGEGTSNTFLIFAQNSGSFVTVNAQSYTGNTSGKDVILKNISLVSNIYNISNPYSNVYQSDSVAYRSNTIGVDFITPNVNLENCVIGGFEKSTNFQSNSYIITFNNCNLQFNRYGLYFNRTSYSNTGEKILLKDCVIGNNNIGIYNIGGMIFLSGTSVDYNYQKWIVNTELSEGGIKNTTIKASDCHFESKLYNEVITNSASLNIENSNIWFEGTKGDVVNYSIKNNGTLSIEAFIRGDGSFYFVDGNSPIKSKLNYISQSGRIKIHKNYNYFQDDINSNSISSLFVNNGAVSLSTSKYLNNSKSIKIDSWLYGQADVVTNKIIPQGSEVSVQFWINDISDAAGTNYSTLYFYDRDNNIIQSINITISTTVTDTWKRVNLNSTKIPINTAYLKLGFKTTGSGLTKSLYVDDLIFEFSNLSSLQYVQKSHSIPIFSSLANARNMSSDDVNSAKIIYTYEAGKESFWKYDAADGSTADDGINVLVTSGGKRFKNLNSPSFNKISIQTGTNKSVGTLALSSGLGTITSTAITTNSIIWITTKTLSGTSAHDYTYNISADGTATVTARQSNGSTETGCNSTIQYWIIN